MHLAHTSAKALLVALVSLPMLPTVPSLPAAPSLLPAASLVAQQEETEARPEDVEPVGPDTTIAPEGALRVFLDCQGPYCDFDFLRREIEFVEFVRDRNVAQVHVLITSQGTGGGGRSFRLSFLGRERFRGLEDEMRFSVRANLADEPVLARLAHHVELGLVRYVARTEAADRLRVGYEAGAGEQGRAAISPGEDPWNFWVFEAGLRGGLEGEERSSSIRLFGELEANRVTEETKVELELSGSYAESTFDVDDTTTVTSLRRTYDTEGLVVWSLGPHWSAGAQVSAGHSSFRNQNLTLRTAPGIEYNLFRYEDSERKQLTFLYTIGPEFFDWQEETIFGETSETRARQRLEVSLNVRQPWGSAGGRFEASSFLGDLDRHRLQLFSGVELRLFEGVSLDLFGQVARVQDQINLPAGDATEEEILLRIRELQTDFEYDLSIGFSYTFGSIFSSVVNPRF